MDEGEEAATGIDRLFAGTLRIEQPKRGHRVGTDAVLLAAAAQIRPGDRFVDVGAGVGAIGLALALREPTATGVLVERDATACGLALRNVAANDCLGRVTVERLDLFDRAACRSAGLAGNADLVVTNPPFYRAGTVRGSPDPNRAAAHVLDAPDGTPTNHRAWLDRACALLKPEGRLVAIHRPEALSELLDAMLARLGDVAVKPVHAHADREAIRVLIAGRGGSRAPLRLLPPLILHTPDGGFTPEATSVHDGTAFIALWSKENRPRRAGLIKASSDPSSRH